MQPVFDAGSRPADMAHLDHSLHLDQLETRGGDEPDARVVS